jgi:hypothetical protein
MRFNLLTQLLSADAINYNAPDSAICLLLREINSSCLQYLEFSVRPWHENPLQDLKLLLTYHVGHV